MQPQDKNIMQRNLRNFLSSGAAELRDHQTEALKAIESFLRQPSGSEFIQAGRDDVQERGFKKGNYFEIVSATGSGKTRMFGTMAKAMDVPTLIVTPRNVLNNQTRKEFCEEIGIPENKIAVYDSKQPARERKRVLEGNPPPQFVITSYQSLPSLIERHELEVTNHNDVHYRPLVILDEVHEGQGPKTSTLLNRLKNSTEPASRSRHRAELKLTNHGPLNAEDPLEALVIFRTQAFVLPLTLH
jgi:superfamily II DNA or RNA helicase